MIIENETFLPDVRLLRWSSVTSRTGLGRSAIYAAMERGTFPKPYKISAQSVAWRESEITAWIEALPYRDVSAHGE